MKYLPIYLVLLSCLSLVGCQGSSANLVPSAVPVGLSAGLPAVDSLRSLSGTEVTSKLGSEVDQWSPTAAINGDELELDSGANELTWGIWAFNTGTFEPQSVDPVFHILSTGAAYLGLADFDANRWEFVGPFSTSEPVPLAARHSSDAGDVYIAVLSFDDSAVAVEELNLTSAGNFAPMADLTADITEGQTPLTVNFDASASTDTDGTITNYEWDFDGDGVFGETVNGEDAAAGSATAQFEYVEVAIYQAEVRVTDNEGAVDTASLAINVEIKNDKPVADLTSDKTAAAPPTSVLFDASGSTDADGVIVNYEWDVNGNGIFNEPGVEQFRMGETTASIAFIEPGLIHAQVRVTDDLGGQDTATLVVTIYGWTYLTVAAADDVGKHCSLSEVDGRPAISYYDDTNNRLMFAYASSATGGHPADWSTLVVDDTGDPGQFASLKVIDGNPAISYTTGGSGNLRYARATTVGGTSAQDWQSLTVDIVAGTGKYSSLAVIDGRPAIAYYYEAEVWDLKYAWADTVAGMAVGDWDTLTVDSTGMTGLYASLLQVNGRAAIAHAQGNPASLMFAHSTSEPGSDPKLYEITLLDDGGVDGNMGRHNSLAHINGTPAITYWDARDDHVMFSRSSTPGGTAPEDWSRVIAAGGTGAGNYTSLVEFEGKPVFSYYNYIDKKLFLAESSTATGGDRNDWTTTQLDAGGDYGSYCSLAVIDGQLAVSYYGESTADLHYAVRLAPKP